MTLPPYRAKFVRGRVGEGDRHWKGGAVAESPVSRKERNCKNKAEASVPADCGPSLLTFKIFPDIVPLPPPGFPRIKRNLHSRSSGAAKVNVDMKPRLRPETSSALPVLVAVTRSMIIRYLYFRIVYWKSGCQWMRQG